METAEHTPISAGNTTKKTTRGPWLGSASESIALIANHDGQGIVLAYAGCSITEEVEDLGRDLETLQLDNAPNGLSIWEGQIEWSAGCYEDPGEAYVRGKFRQLTPNEWERLAATGVPWVGDVVPVDELPEPMLMHKMIAEHRERNELPFWYHTETGVFFGVMRDVPSEEQWSPMVVDGKFLGYGLQEADGLNAKEDQEAIDWAIDFWSKTDRGIAHLPTEQPTPKQLYAMHRLNDPRALASLLREQFGKSGTEAREPGDKVPGKDGEFVTVGVVDGEDGDLIEIDRPDQCETFTMRQARKLLVNLRKGMDVELALQGGR